MSQKIDFGTLMVGETLIIDAFFYDEAGDLANPDTQQFRKSGAGVDGIVTDDSPEAVPATTGTFFVAVTATARGVIKVDWKGSGVGIRPAAQEGFITVLPPFIQ